MAQFAGKEYRKIKIIFQQTWFLFQYRIRQLTGICKPCYWQKCDYVVEENSFKGFTRTNVADTATNAEVLISIDAESKEEVDELAKKAADAGATIFAKPGEKDGWMYGFGFIDPDNHRWNVLYMDMSRMPGNTK